MTAAAKEQRRKRERRKRGIEQVSAFVHKPKFTAWLVWEGHLAKSDIDDPAKIKKALEDYLRSQYWHIGDPSDDPKPKYAAGSFGAEATVLNDLIPVEGIPGVEVLHSNPDTAVGLLEREGQYDWRDPPTIYLITGRKAALLRAVPPHEPNCARATFPEGARLHHDEDLEVLLAEEPEPQDDYDPEEDVEDASADMFDEAIGEYFNEEGYDQ
jgi:hypothetical protein